MSEVGSKQTLPVVALQQRTIDDDVLRVIPLKVAEQFSIIPFEETATELKLAIVYPEQLKQGFYVALEQIGTRIGKKVVLYRTDQGGFKKAIDGYRRLEKEPKKVQVAASSAAAPMQAVGWPPAPAPPLFQLGSLVAYNYLRRIPLDVSRDKRVLCVDYLKPNTYWFVTDGTKDKEAHELVSFIRDDGQITAHVMQVTPAQFDDLVTYYQTLVRHEEQDNAIVVANPTDVQQQEVSNANVVIPDIQAEIVSNEEEKTGLAGLFQRVAQNLTANKSEKGKNERAEIAAELSKTLPQAEAPSRAGQASEAEKLNQAPQSAATPKLPEAPKSLLSNAPTPPGLPQAPQPAAPKAPTPSSAQIVAVPTEESDAATRSAGLEEDDLGTQVDSQISTLDELKTNLKTGVIPKIVAAVLSFAIHEKASDVHIESFEDEVRIRYRIDGQLVDVVKLPADVASPLVSRIKILARLRLDENRVPQDGRFDVKFSDETQVDVRVSVMPTVYGEKVVMRILDKSRGIASLEKLGIEGGAYQNLTRAIQKPYGICLATGPTGSGKSTSLYAILQRIATPNVNVVTLEDPIEYEMKGINQSQVRPKIGFTFADGLRSVLRQDPNIIMVGEIRDGETANMATQAALTGHLVLSTLHTNDAAGAIPRLTNMGIEPFLITSSVNVIMGQRLVRKICSNCRQEVALPDGVRHQLEEDIEQIAALYPAEQSRVKRPIKFFHGMGCGECGGKGYQGRVGIYEVLTMEENMEELVIKRSSATDIDAQARKNGMISMYQDGLLKAINGVTTIDEVLRETTNK